MFLKCLYLSKLVVVGNNFQNLNALRLLCNLSIKLDVVLKVLLGLFEFLFMVIFGTNWFRASLRTFTIYLEVREVWDWPKCEEV